MALTSFASSHPFLFIDDIVTWYQLTLPWGDITITYQPRQQVSPKHQEQPAEPWKDWGHLRLAGSECCPNLSHASAVTTGTVGQSCSTPLFNFAPEAAHAQLQLSWSLYFRSPSWHGKHRWKGQSVNQAELVLMLTEPGDLGQKLQNRCVASSLHRLKQEFLLHLFCCRKTTILLLFFIPLYPNCSGLLLYILFVFYHWYF